MKKVACLFMVFFFLSTGSYSQELTLTEYLNWVLQEHPLAEKARLNPQMRNAQYLQVKGLFDPVLESKFKNKFLKGKEYYSTSNTTLTYNTPYAIGLVGHFDVNSGSVTLLENSTYRFDLEYSITGLSGTAGTVGLFFNELLN